MVYIFLLFLLNFHLQLLSLNCFICKLINFISKPFCVMSLILTLCLTTIANSSTAMTKNTWGQWKEFLFILGVKDCVAHLKFGSIEVFIEFPLFFQNICCLAYNSSIIQFKFLNYIVLLYKKDLTLLSGENIWCEGFNNLTISGFFVNLSYYMRRVYWYQWETLDVEIFPYYIHILSLSKLTIFGNECIF